MVGEGREGEASMAEGPQWGGAREGGVWTTISPKGSRGSAQSIRSGVLEAPNAVGAALGRDSDQLPAPRPALSRPRFPYSHYGHDGARLR